jgi:hypothetical protein
MAFIKAWQTASTYLATWIMGCSIGAVLNELIAQDKFFASTSVPQFLGAAMVLLGVSFIVIYLKEIISPTG